MRRWTRHGGRCCSRRKFKTANKVKTTSQMVLMFSMPHSLKRMGVVYWFPDQNLTESGKWARGGYLVGSPFLLSGFFSLGAGGAVGVGDAVDATGAGGISLPNAATNSMLPPASVEDVSPI